MSSITNLYFYVVIMTFQSMSFKNMISLFVQINFYNYYL